MEKETMSTYHTVRDKNGKPVKVKLTFAKAIKLFCIECMGFQQQEVKKCVDTLCPLFKHKTGVEEKETKKEYSKGQKKEMSERLKKAREAKK